MLPLPQLQGDMNTAVAKPGDSHRRTLVLEIPVEGPLEGDCEQVATNGARSTEVQAVVARVVADPTSA